jgi:hypothetical protein
MIMISDRQELIDVFFEMIRNLNRTAIDVSSVKSFFTVVSMSRVLTPPTVEFMTVLKTYRTGLFNEFKRSLDPSSSMSFLANVNMDVGEALVSLGITDLEDLRRSVKG